MGGKRVTEAEYIQFLKGRDIEYLSGYVNTTVKCLHRCKIDGHEWLAWPSSIRQGKGCPKCAGNTSVIEAEYIQSLEGRDIEYLRGYVNTNVKCLHRCKIDGYEWLALPNKIRKGSGCPKCYGNAPLTEAEYIQSLEGRDIEYLSGYVNTKIKCLHRCKIDGHEWLTTPDCVRRGHGCPKCGGNAPLTEAEYIQSLEGGDIGYLSGYVNTQVKCLHRCKIDGHEWLTPPRDVRRGHGCPKCGGNARVTEAEYIQSLEGRSIEYLRGYVNTIVKCLHRCKIDGYEWLATPINVRSGTGCPKCAKYGFQPDLPGTLYFLISPEGYIKIGITGADTKQRFAKLKSATPFDFTLYGKYQADGEIIARLEKSLHRKLEQHHAGLTGFDGASEWFRASYEVLEAVNRVMKTGSLKKPLPNEVKYVRPKMQTVQQQRA